MTRPGLVPLGVRVRVAPLPDGVGALAVVDGETSAITVSAALTARGRGYALQAALNALTAPRPAGVPWAGVVMARAEWQRAGARERAG